MRPLHLTIEGLRSFRSPARGKNDAAPRTPTIDFANRDHIAIIGDTGAGKSSILEAITYALYGQTTFTAHANQELMNDTSTDLRVVLRFRVARETWEVARSLRRSGQGGVGQARAQLRRLGDDGEPVEQVEQVRRVNERIEELLGLDSAAFLRTVVLPQGRFARLLVEDEPRDRSRILRQVWRTDELEAAGALAARARQAAAELRAGLEQAAAEYPDDPPAHLAQLQADLAAATQRAAAATADERASETAFQTVRDAERAERTASSVIETLEKLDTDRAADRLAPIAALDRALREEEAVLRQQRDELQGAMARIPAADGPTGEEVAAALTTLESLPALATSCGEAAAAARASSEEAAKKQGEAHRLAGRAASGRKEAEDHSAKRPPLDEAAGAARELRATVERKHARCAERSASADDSRKRLESLRTEEADCAKRLTAAEKAERRAARAAREADEHLAAARRAESAAAAAHDLHAGDACPVCRRDLPADWEAPAAFGLAEVTQVADAAHEAARDAAKASTRLDTERKSLERQAAEAEARAAAGEAALQEARRELAQDVDPDLGALDAGAPLPTAEALLGPLEAACTETGERLAQHDRTAEELRSEAARRETAAGVAREAAASADRLADQAQRSATRSVERLTSAVGSIRPPYRPNLILPDAAELRDVDIRPVRKRTEAARARARTLAERATERDRLQREIDGAGAALSGIAQRRANEVDAPLEALVRDLHAHRDVVVDAVTRLQIDAGVPSAVSARDAGALESHIAEIRAAAAETARAAAAGAREAADQADAARARLTAIGERLDARLDPDNLDAVVDSARATADDARFAERRAREEAERFAALVEDVERLHTLLAAVREKERALGDLEDALKPGAFLKWLTLRRSRRLLVHASRMLEEMTGRRYSFVDPGETEEQWRVLDRDSNQPRTPASLSGGEQFIASLSLALGMVEMMARSGGRLESLFLDEGFGSLDRNNLDAAVQALGAVAAKGRMVAVISHVRAVAEQIDHVLAVTRGPTGSRAEWLTRRAGRGARGCIEATGNGIHGR